MKLTELDQYKLGDAIDFHKELNPGLFYNEKMRPEVHEALMDIARDFKEFLGVGDIALVDITLSGSNAAYTYTPHSDIDLHLLVDFNQLSNDQVYRELFDAKKYQYNEQHDIMVRGSEVELYVQDAGQPHISLGEYSLLDDNWNRLPKMIKASIDDDATELKYNKLKNLALRALSSDSQRYLDNVLATIKKYRSAGLDENGEFGPENLAFKMIRKQGYFKKLHDKKGAHASDELSLETADPLTDDLVTELAEYNQPQTVDSYLTDLFNEDTKLFDDYKFDAIHETATKIVSALGEAAYAGNVGAMEVFKFYQTASPDKIEEFQYLVRNGEAIKAWQLVQQGSGTKLQGNEFELEEAVAHASSKDLLPLIKALGTKRLVWRGMSGTQNLAKVDNSDKVGFRGGLKDSSREIMKHLGIKNPSFASLSYGTARFFGAPSIMIPVAPFKAYQSEKVRDMASDFEVSPREISDTYNERMDLDGVEIVFDIQTYYMVSPQFMIRSILDPDDFAGSRLNNLVLDKIDQLGTYADLAILMAEYEAMMSGDVMTEGGSNVTNILYHATYRPLLKSIQANGLGGSGALAKWEDSKPGVTYLSPDPDVALSYAESSDIVPEDWLDNIILLKIDSNTLDLSKLFNDANVINGTDTLEYHGIINDFIVNETQSMNEGVGLIVKGVNTTDDVGVDELKIQAAKMGFNVTTKGIPPVLKASGK